ncbi:MAG: hypothetical protein LLG04_15190 [Parachlamydia sp.]|nr:hypothetical protein [Parachlamydia sp.]
MTASISLSVDSMPGVDGELRDTLNGNVVSGGNLVYFRPDRDLDLGPFDITVDSLTIMARTILGRKESTLKVKELKFWAKKVDLKGRIDCQKVFHFPPEDLKNAELQFTENHPNGPLSYTWEIKRDA